MGLFDLVDVGLCQWWDCFEGLFDLVDVRCWMWVCLVWWMVCADLSGFFFLFFIEVALVDVRQWLLVAVGVVVAVLVRGRCCHMVVGPGLVMKMIIIVIGIGRRKYIILLCSKYYFNV